MTITPDDLRALADGLANQNSHAERIAARYAASADMLDALKQLVAWQEPTELLAPQLGGLLKSMYAAKDAIAKAERAEP